MQKRILFSIMTIALVGTLIGGGIYAYFSDVETSTGNTFTAGTLDLNLDDGNTNVVKFTLDNVKPGDTGGGTWKTSNVGTIPGYLDLESISVSEAIGTTTDPEEADEPSHADTAQLGNYLMVHLFVDDDHSGSWDSGEADIFGTNVSPAAINTIDTNYDLSLSMAASAGIEYVTLVWSVPTSTDNRIQGDSVTLDITFELQQRAAD